MVGNGISVAVEFQIKRFIDRSNVPCGNKTEVKRFEIEAGKENSFDVKDF